MRKKTLSNVLNVGSNSFDQSRSSVIRVSDSYFTNKLRGNGNWVY